MHGLIPTTASPEIVQYKRVAALPKRGATLGTTTSKIAQPLELEMETNSHFCVLSPVKKCDDRSKFMGISKTS